MASRITIFDKNGFFVGDIRGSAPRSWVLNADPGPGECNIPVSKYDDKATQRYLQFGNYVLIRHESLPDWIGIIYGRKWSSGYINVKAIQCEYLLSKRRTPIVDVKGVAGSIFNQILTLNNSEPFNDKPVYPNSIYYASPERSQKIRTDSLSIIQDLAIRSGNDFAILHALDTNGRLYLVGNWYQQRGEMTNQYLREGLNIQLSDGDLEEDARGLINYLEGRGDANTDGTRVSSISYDETSINAYGLNQASNVFDGNRERATVESNTLNFLRSVKDPLRTYDIVALNVGTTFDYLGIGNIHNLELNRNGFKGNGLGTDEQVQTLGMEYDDDLDTCRLIVEKYTDANQS